MKRLLLALLTIICLSSISGYAATVSGTVSSTATCSTLGAGNMVLLRDSSFNVIDSTLTNSSGFYTMNFPAAWPTGKPYVITVNSCSNVWNTPGHYTGSNATINPIVCGQAKKLSGTVMLGSTANTGAAVVYLVKVQRNYPTAGDTTLTAVDSNVLSSTGSFSFSRLCAPTDTFLIKAALLPSHPSYSSYLPSYDSSLTWSSARRYYGSSFTSFATSGYNIYLFSGTNTGGPGFIGGSVLVGANKGTAVGDPLAKRLLMLTNSTTGAPVAYTYSDAAGKFSLPNIPVGTYKLFGDAWGLYNVPLTVTITTASPTVNNIIFEENNGENTFKGRFKTTGVGNVPGALAGVSVYPNPATTQVTLDGLGQVKGSKTVVLRNLVGATVNTKTFADGQAVSMSVDALPAGAYMLQLTTEVGTASFKVVK